MPKPKTLGNVAVRELQAAFGDVEQFKLVKRLISGAGWSAQRVEFALILNEEQISRLAEFLGETYNTEPFVGL